MSPEFSDDPQDRENSQQEEPVHPLTEDEGLGAGPPPVATIAICVGLALLYVLSSIPTLVVPNPWFLNWVSLDVMDVLREGQYWRLITANLFHASVIHLGSNLFAFFIFGVLLEKRMERGILLAWMVVSLLGCDIASLWFGVPNSIGVSGVVYGLQTGFILLCGKELIFLRTQPLLTTMRSLFGYLLVMILINTINTGNTNIYGHLGGAAGGLFCALVTPISGQASTRTWIFLTCLISLGFGLLITLITAFQQLLSQ